MSQASKLKGDGSDGSSIFALAYAHAAREAGYRPTAAQVARFVRLVKPYADRDAMHHYGRPATRKRELAAFYKSLSKPIPKKRAAEKEATKKTASKKRVVKAKRTAAKKRPAPKRRPVAKKRPAAKRRPVAKKRPAAARRRNPSVPDSGQTAELQQQVAHVLSEFRARTKMTRFSVMGDGSLIVTGVNPILMELPEAERYLRKAAKHSGREYQRRGNMIVMRTPNEFRSRL